MSTYLLNTSVLVDALRGVGGRPEILERLIEDGHLLACSAITVAEVFAGMRPKEREATVALLDSLEHYDITRPVAEQAGLLRREWSARGKTLALPDLLIASVALTHGLILLTDDTVLILDRGRPVARLESAIVGSESDADGRLARLERQGLVRRATVPLHKSLLSKKVPRAKNGASLSNVLLEERREGR